MTFYVNVQIFVEGDLRGLFCVFIQVCDSILNIGPCANASMGEPAFLSEEVHTLIHSLVSL